MKEAIKIIGTVYLCFIGWITIQLLASVVMGWIKERKQNKEAKQA